MDRNQESRLVALAKDGDHNAFEQLVGPLQDRIYFRALKAVQCSEEASDILQEVLLRAFTRLCTYRGDARFTTWLYTVTTNCIRMHLQAVTKRAEIAFEEIHLSVQTERSHPISPLEAAEVDQFIEICETHIDALDSKYGVILSMWIGGMNVKEISAKTGLTRTAVKSRIHRARNKLRELLQEHYPELSSPLA